MDCWAFSAKKYIYQVMKGRQISFARTEKFPIVTRRNSGKCGADQRRGSEFPKGFNKMPF